MKLIRVLCGAALALASFAANAAFDTAAAYVVVKSTDGTIYYLQQGVYYQITSPYASVSASTVGALTQQFSAVSPGSGGGGGGASTIADGADVNAGTTTDAAATAGGTGTISAKLRRISTQLPAAVGPQTPANSLATANPAATGAQTSVAASATDVTCLAANAARKGATIYNDSASATLYLLLANATSSTTAYSLQLIPSAYYEVPYQYTGVIKCIWSAAVGSARVTELTN